MNTYTSFGVEAQDAGTENRRTPDTAKGITKLKRYIEENSCQAEELERRLSKNPLLYQGYLALSGEWKRRFQEYMAGKKTLPLTYDPFFKKLF